MLSESPYRLCCFQRHDGLDDQRHHRNVSKDMGASNRPCRICKGTGVAYDIVPGAGHGKRIGMKPVACDHCEGTGQEPEEKWPRFETLDTDELRKLALEGRRHGGFITSPGIVLSLLDEIERLKRMGS